MAFETKEQVLEKILSQKKPKCPHCDQEMKIWEVPPMNVGDGLGWGSPFYIFVLMMSVRFTSRAGNI